MSWKICKHLIGNYGGSNKDFSRADTAMGFLKSLTDGLNHTEFRIPDYQPSTYDQQIESIHFYHNIAFLCKRK